MLSDIEKIILQLENLEKYDYANNKFYHIKSIKNFIFHFEQIGKPKKKREIIEKLSEYFLDIESEPIFDQNRSLTLFR